ncbi:MAG: allantoinase AllB [Verrucomicrobia bacterium]|nr:MAG: allantoinase AllB [Verrucomicrobiota bacterium]
MSLLIQGGMVVTPAEVLEVDILIADGKIAEIGSNVSESGHELLDARGLHAFPGLIDAHVHFNEPGRADWEGLETGSRALAAGGGTLFFDMPLNASPPTLDAESFNLKLAAAKSKSIVDFAFWGGLVPQNLDHLEELAECGVIGFKAFMSDSGMEDFPWSDDKVLREGMKRAARLGLPVAVHAESQEMTSRLAEEKIAQGRKSVQDYLDSRPIPAELDAIRRALDIAGETGCALHIVHVSCGKGVQLITEARRRGVDVSCETCPHYLTLTQGDMVRIGATAKCAPPLRTIADQRELWEHVMAGAVTTIGSDHSPSPLELKRGENFFKVWGGISGAQHTLSLLLTEIVRETARPELKPSQILHSRFVAGVENGVLHQQQTLSHLASFLSQGVVKRFNLPKSKSGIVVGADADLALVDLDAEFEVRTEDLFYRHAQTPYLGRKLHGRVTRTLVRGHTVFKDGQIVSAPLGSLVKPVL